MGWVISRGHLIPYSVEAAASIRIVGCDRICLVPKGICQPWVVMQGRMRRSLIAPSYPSIMNKTNFRHEAANSSLNRMSCEAVKSSMAGTYKCRPGGTAAVAAPLQRASQLRGK